MRHLELYDAIAHEAAPRLHEFRPSGLVALCGAYAFAYGARRPPPSRVEAAKGTEEAHHDREDHEAAIARRPLDLPPVQMPEMSTATSLLLEQLALQLAARHAELTEHETLAAESSFRKLRLSNPFGDTNGDADASRLYSDLF